MLDLDERPATDPALSDVDDDLIHVACCNPDLALCGEDLSASIWWTGGITDEEMCTVCELAALNGFGCSAPGCPERVGPSGGGGGG